MPPEATPHSAFDPLKVDLGQTQLIEASAGTGKTYTLTALYLRLILTGYPLEKILVVTFTEAATAELRERIRSRLRKTLALANGSRDDDPLLTRALQRSGCGPGQAARRLQRALSSFDNAAIFTIHAFCRRVLQENAFESGISFDPELVSDPWPLYEEIVTDFWSRTLYNAPEPHVRLLEESRVSPATLLPLVAMIAARPELIVLPPEDHGPQDLDFESLYGRARRLWQNQKDQIAAVLDTHPALNRRVYTRRNLPRWLEQTDAYFESQPPVFPPTGGGIQRLTLGRLSEKAKPSTQGFDHPFFEACDMLCDYPHRWLLSFQQRLLTYARQELAIRKTRRGIQFFDDLIQQLETALNSAGGQWLAQRIRERYQAGLIDEFQDTDQAQYRIFKRIFTVSELPLFLIGDPKQSIYAFRGADIFAYLKAADHARGHTHTLGINWRSDPGLIKAVNALFTNAPKPFIYDRIRFEPVHPRPGADNRLHQPGAAPPAALRALFVPRSAFGIPDGKAINKTTFGERIPALIAADISRLLNSPAVIGGQAPQRVHPGHMAVLVRTNHQARKIQGALRRWNIPSVLTSARSVFDTNEARELWRVARAAADPTDAFQVRAALSTDLLGLDGRELWDLTQDDRQWEAWSERFHRWHRLWRESGFGHMLQAIFGLRPAGRNTQLLTGLLKRIDGERRVTNLEHLAELLHQASREHHLGIQGLLRWLARRMGEADPTDDSFELRLESDDRAVQLVTIHKAKGLEYPLVYVPYAWQARPRRKPSPPVVFHDPARDFKPVCDLGSDQLTAAARLAATEEHAENQRLLYVALTRARHQCTLVWGAVRDAERSSLGRLLHPRVGPHDDRHTHPVMADMNDAQLRGVWEALAAQTAGAIAVETAPRTAGERFAAALPAPATLGRRTRRRGLRRGWYPLSFSRLVSDTVAATPDQEEGRDHDTAASLPAAAAMEVIEAPPAAHQQVILHAFDRGPRAGDCLHSIYERADFHPSAGEALPGVVSGQLNAFGYDPDRWTATICRAIAETLQCPLDRERPRLRLAQILPAKRLNELAFVFPVAAGDAPGPGPVAAPRLAEVLADADLSPQYRQQLARMPSTPLKGFMKGFIDLVFEHQGRWYIVDYKSNFLGEHYADYTPLALKRAMAEHHYHLQYYIYTAALHRYLSYRLDAYDYDTHFGGVFYLFVRGMAPELGPDCGVFAHRPEKQTVEGLLEVLK